MRNGGRHRCQPPLRRAKDPPVFANWLRPKPPRPRSWLTSSGVASHPTRSPRGGSLPTSEAARPKACCSSDRPAGARRQAIRCSAALLGMTALEFPRPRPAPKSAPVLHRPKRKIISSGASSRLVLVRVVKLFAPEEASSPRFPYHRLPAEIGSSVACRRLALRLSRRLGHRPDHPLVMRLQPSRSKRIPRLHACG